MTIKTNYKSISDASYQQAKAGDVVANVATYFIGKIAGFPQELSKESKAEIVKGYRVRYNEVFPAIKAKTEGGDTTLTVEYAYSYGQQAFGGLKAEKPLLHAQLKVIRDATSTYCSNRLADVVFQAKRIQGQATKKSRPEAIDFVDRITKVFDDLESKVKVAVERNDSTADVARFKAAKAAFMKVWKV